MKNQAKTVLLLGVLTAILVAIGGAVSPSYIPIFGGIGVLLNILSYFFSDKIVLAIHHARPVSEQEAPGLHAMVADLAHRAGIPKPRVCVVEDPSPNAFATGRNPEHGVVACTTGILQLLSERELRGVLAHEISHIRNRDILIQTVAAVIGSLIASVAWAVRWGAMLGGRSGDRDDGGGLGTLALAIVAPIVATLLQLAVSRSREYLADETGGKIAGDPGSLADALARLEHGSQRIPIMSAQAAPATAGLFIVNPLRGGGVMRLFSTHPPMAERIQRLRQQAAQMGPQSQFGGSYV